MKHHTVATLFSMLLLALAPAGHAATCSTVTVAGTWGFTLTGNLLLPTAAISAAAVGRIKADLDGNIAGTEARNVGGGYADETVAGTWTVNSDCTGSLTVNAYESGQLVRTSVLALVFDDHSARVRMIQKSLTLPDGTQVPVVITLEGDKH